MFQAHRHHLAEELGLEPSPRLRRLEASILRGDIDPDAEPLAPTDRSGWRTATDEPSIDGLSRQRLTGDGIDLAWGELGAGSAVIVVPAWLSNLAMIAEGRDPRSALIEHLARDHRAMTYDRRGTGLSGGTVRDFGVDAAVDELEAVLEHLGEPAALFAMSGAGPIAVACAARRPDRVSHLVLFGTYASGPETFGDVGRPILDLLRQRPNIATELLAGLYRPGASGAATLQFARHPAGERCRPRWRPATSKRSTTPMSPTSSTRCGRRHWCCTTAGDRVIPFAGGEALAAALPSARFIAEGRRLAPAGCPRRRRHHRRGRGAAGFVTSGPRERDASGLRDAAPTSRRQQPWSHEMTETADLTRPEPVRHPHPVRAWANAQFFESMDWYLHRRLGDPQGGPVRRPAATRRRARFGSGRFDALPRARQPPHRHRTEPARARRTAPQGGAPRDRPRDSRGTGRVDRSRTASVDAVICTLVLCTVEDQAPALAEVHRILRPGRTFRVHRARRVRPGPARERCSGLLRRPWRYVFDGCCLDRDTAAAIEAAGFTDVQIEHFRLGGVFVPVWPQISGVAVA